MSRRGRAVARRATAEIFWSPAELRDYADFRRRMTLARKRVIARHVNAAPLPEVGQRMDETKTRQEEN